MYSYKRFHAICLLTFSLIISATKAFIAPDHRFAGIGNQRNKKTWNKPILFSTKSSDATPVTEIGDTKLNGLSNADHIIRLPRHATNIKVNDVLEKTERYLKKIHVSSTKEQNIKEEEEEELATLLIDPEKKSGPQYDRVFANSYVDLGRVDTVGFDFDYTLVTYTQRLLEVIYDMALERLVTEFEYPKEMLEDQKMKFDPKFPIRGLCVDQKNAWICHVTYTYKVGVAWEGRKKVSRDRLIEEYSGKRSLTPTERKKRLKPLNDLFSMSECCLIADTIQYFNDRDIPYCSRSAVNDVCSAIGKTHVSGDFHRLVAKHPEIYFEPQPYLKEVLQNLKDSGKRLILVSNSPFWYVNSGMTYFLGENWKELWDVVIVSAGKPSFYLEDTRPFREVSTRTGRIKFKRIDKFETGEVYTEGCLRELTKCLDWKRLTHLTDMEQENFLESPNVLYIGDSLFADLFDAKREFGWTTAAVTPEVGKEIEIQTSTEYMLVTKTIDVLVNLLRSIQDQYGTTMRTSHDLEVLDSIQRLVSKWRDEQVKLLGNPFGSIFRARHEPSSFSHCLRRYCDLYMNSVGSLRHYSAQHRFFPDDARLLSHEIRGTNPECWDLDSIP